MKSRRPALFLDRDGTLIKEVNYLTTIDQLAMLDGSIEALRLAHAAGMATVLITNQSAVARGMLTETELQRIHHHLSRLIVEKGGVLDGVYYCPHHPEGSVAGYAAPCQCRKPQPGLLLAAARELGLNLSKSLMVGDSLKDVEAGRKAGCTSVLVETGYGARESALIENGENGGTVPDYVAPDILEAVRWFLTRREG